MTEDIALWQKIRRRAGCNFYTTLTDHEKIVLFNGKFPMNIETAEKNINNDPNPHNWKTSDFVCCTTRGFKIDVVARWVYNKKVRDNIRLISEVT